MAILVVCDTSPIRALHHLGMLHLMRELYGTVLVPSAVALELLEPTTTCPSINVKGMDGVEIRTPSGLPSSLGIPDDLDAGETQAIALAIEIRADLLLMDERKGTEAARQLGLLTIGVIGVLLEAKRRNLIPAVLPLLDRLVAELRFFISDPLRTRIGEMAAEI